MLMISELELPYAVSEHDETLECNIDSEHITYCSYPHASPD